MTDRTDASRVAIDLTAVVIAMHGDAPQVLTVAAPEPPLVALPSGPLQTRHRTLQAGLRSWVEARTEQPLGYVEQLYTFGDRQGLAVGPAHDPVGRTISIAYMALVCPSEGAAPADGRWRPWYDFFPWEDRRRGEPPAAAAVVEPLRAWARDRGRRSDPDCPERVCLTFGLGPTPWDDERALERYELLYEAGLVAEAAFDRGETPGASQLALPGRAMFADHRRILATAISRLRAKIKYRPVLFELMPESFTLLQLQRTAEALSGVPLHKQNFRRLIAQQNLVEETGELATDTGGRPAKLMRFRREVMLERPAPGLRLRATRRASYP